MHLMCLLSYADFIFRVGIWLVLGAWLVWRLCIFAHGCWEWYAEREVRIRRLDGPFRVLALGAVVTIAGCGPHRHCHPEVRRPLPPPRHDIGPMEPCHGLTVEECRDKMRGRRR